MAWRNLNLQSAIRLDNSYALDTSSVRVQRACVSFFLILVRSSSQQGVDCTGNGIQRIQCRRNLVSYRSRWQCDEGNPNKAPGLRVTVCGFRLAGRHNTRSDKITERSGKEKIPVLVQFLLEQFVQYLNSLDSYEVFQVRVTLLPSIHRGFSISQMKIPHFLTVAISEFVTFNLN